jgi:hypothetical protein
VECKAGSKKRHVIWFRSLKLDPTSEKMGEEVVVGSFVTKCSCQTKAEMAMVKVKKVIAKENCEAKKLTKLVTVAKLGFA